MWRKMKKTRVGWESGIVVVWVVGGGRQKENCVSPGMGEMKCEFREWRGIGQWWRMNGMGNEHKTATDSERETENLDTSKISPSTCASGKATSMMLGWPRGSPFSSREKITWYPRIWPCCFTCRGGFQVTRMAVEFMASTSSFLGGAPGTDYQKREGGNSRVKQKERQWDSEERGKESNMLS